MSSFKSKLKQILAESYYDNNHLNNCFLEQKSQNPPKIKGLYSYCKIERTIKSINKKNHNDVPTKLFNNFEPGKIHKIKDLSKYTNKYNTINNSPRKRTMIRSHSNYELPDTKNKFKDKLSFTKNLLEFSRYSNNDISYKDNVSIQNKNTSFRNRPVRNLSCKLFDVDSNSIINNIRINYKTYDTIDFKSSRGILGNRKKYIRGSNYLNK